MQGSDIRDLVEKLTRGLCVISKQIDATPDAHAKICQVGWKTKNCVNCRKKQIEPHRFYWDNKLIVVV